MKHTIVYLLICIGICSCTPQRPTSFVLKGTIDWAVSDSTKILLSYLVQTDGKWEEVNKETHLSRNEFYFEGDLDELTYAYLCIEDVEIPLYLEPSAMRMTISGDDPYNYEIFGLSVVRDNAELRNMLSAYVKVNCVLSDHINEIFGQIDLHSDEPAVVDSLMERAYSLKPEMTANAEKMDSAMLNFVIHHHTSRITPHLLYLLSRDNLIAHDIVTEAYDKLPASSKASLLGRLASAQIEETALVINAKDVSVGDVAPDFSKESMQGETIRLSDFRGKAYVLLDFWASWCAPCIQQIPQMKGIQEAYGNAGLKIIGISLDGDKQEWLDAIEKHEMGAWSHLLSSNDLTEYFIKAGDISAIYNVKYVPLYILIDKQGIVLSRWQHIGEDEIAFIDKLLR